MQAAGTHPAPCARHCESTAYEIEIRRLRHDIEHHVRIATEATQEAKQLRAELAAAAPAPAGVPMPKPVAYGFGNTAITGHTNRLMMVRIDIPGGDQYAGAFWLPLVLADEAHAYGVACRAAGEAAGYARAANWLRASAEKHAEENGYHEHDTGSFVFASREAEEWNNSVLELADEMDAALRGEVKP